LHERPLVEAAHNASQESGEIVSCQIGSSEASSSVQESELQILKEREAVLVQCECNEDRKSSPIHFSDHSPCFEVTLAFFVRPLENHGMK
jgi:hypothetical protein